MATGLKSLIPMVPDFFRTGMMEVLKQVGMRSDFSEVLKMSVNTKDR